jgi:hypothetical protein
MYNNFIDIINLIKNGKYYNDEIIYCLLLVCDFLYVITII